MHETVESARVETKAHGMVSQLCGKVGMSRQNYYARRRKGQRQEIDEEFVLTLVKGERRIQPRLGGRKTLLMISQELDTHQVKLGRDRFFKLLRKHGLLIKKKKRRFPKTTHARHCLPVFRNLLVDREATAPNEIWVSDLTYIRTREGFIYAALITDACSRKIVGANAGESLEVEGCLTALEQALNDLPKDKFPVHHSDRGSQYCCHAYVDRLRERECPISMTEHNHCAENALAERLNGILKQEYGLDAEFPTKKHALHAFSQAVVLYNHRRPHGSLNNRVPALVHQEQAA